MKFLNIHYDEYINNIDKFNLHDNIKYYNNVEIENLNNIIFYGPSGCGKYTQCLYLIKNYSPSELSKAISLINGRKSTEASGRIGKNNIIEYAETGVDFISIGELTNNLKSIDMSLKAMVF